MKTLKYIFIGFVALVVIVFLGGYIFLKSFDLNRYKPQIITQASKALGRPVDIKNLKLNLSLKDGLVLQVEGLAISDLPQFQTAPLLNVATIHVGVDVEAYLKNKTIRVTSIRVLSPHITVVRTKTGELNVQSLAPQAPAAPAPATQPAQPTAPSASKTTALPFDMNSLVIDSLNVSDGEVVFINQSLSPELILNVKKLSVSVQDFSLINPFLFKMKAAVGGSMENIFVEGSAHLGIQEFSLNGNIDSVELSQAINQSGLPVKIQGQVMGQFSASAEGVAPEALTQSLQGQSAVSIKDGKLVDMNVLKTVLDKMSMLPDLVEKIKANLSEHYKEVLEQKDTVFRKIEMTTQVAQGFINIEKADIEAEGFSLPGQGTVGFDQSLNLNWSLIIEKELSASMIQAVNELQYIANENGQIQIPVRVAGQATAPEIVLDMDYLTKRIFANRGKEELNKVLDKVFGDEQNPSDGQNQSPERKAIESILDNIFK